MVVLLHLAPFRIHHIFVVVIIWNKSITISEQLPVNVELDQIFFDQVIKTNKKSHREEIMEDNRRKQDEDDEVAIHSRIWYVHPKRLDLILLSESIHFSFPFPSLAYADDHQLDYSGNTNNTSKERYAIQRYC